MSHTEDSGAAQKGPIRWKKPCLKLMVILLVITVGTCQVDTHFNMDNMSNEKTLVV